MGRACNWGALTYGILWYFYKKKIMTTTATSVEPYLTHQKYSEYSSTLTRGNTL